MLAFTVVCFFSLLQLSLPQLTPLQVAVSARTYDVQHYVDVRDENGHDQRIVLNYFQPNVTVQARELCVGNASPELTSTQHHCMEQLIPLLISRHHQLVSEIEERASKNIISMLTLQLQPPGGKSTTTTATATATATETATATATMAATSTTTTTKKLPITHGGLSNVLTKIDAICSEHSIQFSDCDHLRSSYISEQIKSEKKSILSAVKHVSENLRSSSGSGDGDNSSGDNSSGDNSGEKKDTHNKSKSTGSSDDMMLELRERVELAFESISSHVHDMETYAKSRKKF